MTNFPTKPQTPASIVIAACLSSILLTAACAKKPAAAPAPIRIENADLNLLFTDIPDGLEVAVNDPTKVELTVQSSADPAVTPAERRLTVQVDPASEFGIQLTEIVNGQRAVFEGLPQGSYSGAREITVPLAGKGFYVRGQFDDSGQMMEEVRVFLVHPTENRLVTFASRYPQGSSEVSAERIQELLAWIAEMEALQNYEEAKAQEEDSE